MTIQQLLELTIAKNASDLHLSVGFHPLLRVHGELFPIPGSDPISPHEIESLISPLLTHDQLKLYTEQLDFDFSFQLFDKGRFRVNLYRQRGYPAAALRLIPLHIPTIEELELPAVVTKLTELKQGLVLVTGPTGHGKSTALASMINRINMTRAEHIITVEDPIEYMFPSGRSLVSQREVYRDTQAWDKALRSALREDPNVVLVGEMRDLETISAAITIAETGHLVFATLHTNSASQSIDRMIDVFPQNQQAQIRTQLAATLEAVISLRLIPTINPGRVLAYEVLLMTPAGRNMIREAKTYLIDNTIQTSADLGMITLENSLAKLIREGRITMDQALKYSLRPEILGKLLR